MTKTNSWICDICKKEFHTGKAGFGANIGFTITIPSGSQYEKEVKFTFEDTCLDCRANLAILIENLIK